MSKGQITPDSPFGFLLTNHAQEAETIVELGTFGGMGSTLCLKIGLRPSAKLYSVEIDPEMWRQAWVRWQDEPNMVFLLGRIGDKFDDYEHPGGESMRNTLGYDFSRDQFFKAPKVLDQLPDRLDAILIDAGEFSATGELDVLIERCTGIIALDDCNPAVSHKNVENRLRLIREGWTVLSEDLNDRNGWGIYRKPSA